MGNLIPSNNNDDNLDFNPTKLPGCKVWLDASDESTLFTTDYQGSVTVPDNFIPTSVSGCSTWYDSSDASTLYNTSAGPVTAVSSPTDIGGCALWLDASDSSTLYKTDAAAAIPVTSPLDIGGCVAWWDGSDISTFFQNNDGTSPVTASGQLVGSWVDKANSRIASAPGTNNKPMYQTSVVNGKSALLFDGWNDYFSVLNMPSQTNETVFIVTRANFQESKTHVLIGDQSPTGYGIQLYTSAAVNYIRGSYGGYTPGFTGFIYNMPGNSNIDPVLICARRNSSGASLREAGTDIQSSTTQFTLAYRYIGADPGTGSVGMAGNNVLNGHICEIIIYSSDLSSSDRAKVESYLATKWGIQRTFDLAVAGSGVGSWKDKSGNVRDFTSATSKPTITASAIGGKSALSFDGVDDRLANSSTISSGNAGLSVFVVVRGTFPGNSTFLFTHKSAEGGLDSNDLSIGWSAEQGSAWSFGTLRSRSKSIRSGVAYTSDKRFDSIDVSGVGIASVVSSFAATSSTNSSFWQGAEAQSSLGASDGVSLAGMTIGFRNGITPDLFYVGQIAEIIAFNTALSTTDRARIEKYLSNKWGISNIHIQSSSGDPIGYWGDKSGNAKHALQEIGSYRPSYTGTVNSLPAITFDGTDDHFLIGDLSSLFPNFGEVFVVHEGNNFTAAGLYQTQVNYAYYVYSGENSFGAFTNTRSTPASLGIPRSGVHLISMRANSSSMQVRFDGNSFYSANGLGYSGGSSHAIGYTDNGVGLGQGLFMKGKIVEVITYNTDIGAENRAKVEQYLAKKWGIDAGLHKVAKKTNDKIGYVRSKGVENTHLSQFNHDNRPKIGSLANKKAIDFTKSSVNCYLQSPTLTTSNNAFSFFVVYSSNSTNTVLFTLGVQDALRLISRYAGNTITYGGSNNIYYDGNPYPISIPKIESLIKTAGGTNTTYTKLYANGKLYNPSSSLGLAAEMTSSYGWLVLSGYSSPYTYTGYNNVTMGEFIYYNRTLSEQERVLVEKYLNDKWNINALTTAISKPTDISGCSLWLDANDSKTLFTDTAASTNISSDGQTIAYWADKVAGQDVIQTTVAARPTYRANMQNGRPMIYFDGGDDLLSQVNRPYVAPCTLFVVCRIDSHSGDISGILTHGDSTGGLNGPGFVYIGSTATGACLVFLDGVGAATAATSNTSSSMLGLPRIITGVYNQSNTSNSLIYVNGNLEENFTGTGVSLSSTANRIQIGARTGGGQPARKMIGYVAECIRYDRVLTDNERAMVENYLSEKWGIGSYSSPVNIGSAIKKHEIKVSNTDAQNWVDRVFANGGTVSQRTADFVSTFCKQIESAGLRQKFYRLNLFCGNDLAACLTPLYLGTDSNTFYGNRTESNTGFIGSDYSELLGLRGNGSTYLLTGISPDSIGCSSTGHISIYQNSFNFYNPYSSIRALIGTGYSTTNRNYLEFITQNAAFTWGDTNTKYSSYAGGLYVGVRNSASSVSLYEQGVSLADETSSSSGTPQTGNIAVFGATGIGSSMASYYTGTLKAYSLGKDMTPEEVTSFNEIMESFQTSLSRGSITRSSDVFASVTNEDAKRWIDNIYYNGGTVSSSTALAVNNFCNSIDSAGLRSKFYRLNLFCGNNLAACLVPLYKGSKTYGERYGEVLDVLCRGNGTGAYFDNSDYIETGEGGGLQGRLLSESDPHSGPGLRTGIITQNILEFLSDKVVPNSSTSRYYKGFHMAYYCKSLKPQVSSYSPMGFYSGYNASRHGSTITAGPSTSYFSVGPFAATVSTSYDRVNRGLYLANFEVQNTTLISPPNYDTKIDLYAGGSQYYSAPFQLGPYANPEGDIQIFSEGRELGTSTTPSYAQGLFRCSQNLQGYSIGIGFNESEVAAYYLIMKTFQDALSRNIYRPSDNPTFSSITNEDAKLWIDDVYGYGGSVSISTAQAVNTFCNTIDSAGIRDRFYRLNLFCGDNLTAARIPLYKGPAKNGDTYGNGVDVNNNFVSTDYNESGSLAGIKGNGSNKYLNTGLGTNFTTANNLSFGAYITTPTTIAFGSYMGCFQTTGSADPTILYYRGGAVRGVDAVQAYPLEVTNSTLTGHHILSRTASNDYFQVFNGVSGTASTNVTPAARGSTSFGIMAITGPANPTLGSFNDGRISMYHIGLGLTPTQASAFYGAIDQFNQSMGRTRPSDSFASLTNEEAKIWVDNVYMNGGTVSSGTALAVNTLCDSIDSNGLRSKIYRLNLFCGNNLNSALVPVYRGPNRSVVSGNLTDSNNNFVSGDYNETGSSGGLKGNGSNKYLNPGMTTLGSTGNESISCYVLAESTNSPYYLLGSHAVANNNRTLGILYEAGVYTIEDGHNPGGAFSTGITQASGLRAASSFGLSLRKMYLNGSVVFTSSAATTAASGAITPYVFTRNNQGSAVYVGNQRIGSYHIGISMSDSDMAVFYTAIETFQAALFRDRPSNDPVFASITNSDAKLWIDNVYANHGTVSTTTANAVNTFCNAIDNAGIRDRFYRLNLFAGNNLNAALVPLYRGQSSSGSQVGGSTDTNINFISDNYSESSGLNTTSGGGQYLNTNLSPDSMALTDVQAMHLAFSHGPTTSGDTDPRPIGTASATDRFHMSLTIRSSSPGVMTTCLGRTNSVISSNLATGAQTSASWVAARTSATSLSIYKNGIVDTTLETSVTGILSHSNVFYVGLSNNNGATIGNSVALAHRHYSIGASMTASQISSYESALTVFRAAIGRMS